MKFRPLDIEGAWEMLPQKFEDERGYFMEWFASSSFEPASSTRFTLEQANLSVSKAGVIRGIHFADVPPSQAKYVTCVKGEILDVVVDIRTGSPTFGRWEGVRVNDTKRNALYISEGLGHAFMALSEDAAVIYLCSEGYAPGREHGVNPMDPSIGIEWPSIDVNGGGLTPILSEKDTDSRSLEEARQQDLLPSYEDAITYRRTLAPHSPTN